MPKRRLNPRLLAWAAVLLLGAVFAVQGGEYGTSDLFQQRARMERLASEVDSLRDEVDSLERYRTAILEDAATQERIAREEFGMIRPGEILYRFDRPDDAPATPADSGDGP